MELKDIIKAAEGKELDSGVIDAIKALDQSAEVARLTKDLESEQGKSGGILDDKKKYKDRAEKAEGELKKITDGKLPAEELHKKQLAEMQEKLDKETADREAQETNFKAQQREARLADITGSVKWTDGTPHDTAKLIIKSAMAELDDLSDKTKIADVLKTITESHKSFISADAPGGTGGKSSGNGTPPNDKNEAPSIAENQKALWGDK